MKLLAFSTALYVASSCFSLIGQTIPAAGEIGPWAQLGTAGVLAWVVSLLIGELRATRTDGAEQRKQHANSWQNAENHWHEEAEKDRSLMIQMVETCAASRRAAATHDTRRDAQDARREAQDTRREAEQGPGKPEA